jgi:hypothetical protein
VIPRQATGDRFGHCHPQPVHADLAAQQTSDLLIGDARVGQHRYHQLGDGKLVLTLPGPLG